MGPRPARVAKDANRIQTNDRNNSAVHIVWALEWSWENVTQVTGIWRMSFVTGSVWPRLSTSLSFNDTRKCTHVHTHAQRERDRETLRNTCISKNMAQTHTSKHILACLGTTYSAHRVTCKPMTAFPHCQLRHKQNNSWPIPTLLTAALWAWTLNRKGNTTCLSCYRRHKLHLWRPIKKIYPCAQAAHG